MGISVTLNVVLMPPSTYDSGKF